MPGWLGRILIVLVLTQAAMFLARPVTSYRALALGGDELVIGLITASFAVLPLLVAVPLGRVADRRRPVGMLVSGVVVLVASYVLLGMAGTLGGLALWSALLGLGHLALMLAAQSLIAQQSDNSRHDQDFGLMAAAVSLGQLIGPVLGGLVLSAGTAGSLEAPPPAPSWSRPGSAPSPSRPAGGRAPPRNVGAGGPRTASP